MRQAERIREEAISLGENPDDYISNADSRSSDGTFGGMIKQYEEAGVNVSIRDALHSEAVSAEANSDSQRLAEERKARETEYKSKRKAAAKLVETGAGFRDKRLEEIRRFGNINIDDNLRSTLEEIESSPGTVNEKKLKRALRVGGRLANKERGARKSIGQYSSRASTLKAYIDAADARGDNTSPEYAAAVTEYNELATQGQDYADAANAAFMDPSGARSIGQLHESAVYAQDNYDSSLSGLSPSADRSAAAKDATRYLNREGVIQPADVHANMGAKMDGMKMVDDRARDFASKLNASSMALDPYLETTQKLVAEGKKVAKRHAALDKVVGKYVNTLRSKNILFEEEAVNARGLIS
jgi:hypothetical protein